MPEYNIIHILTVPMIVFSIYKLMNTFFVEGVHNKKIEITSYLAYAIATSVLIFLTRIPVVLMGFNLIFIFLISLNYIDDIKKKFTMTVFIYSILLVIELVISVLTGISEISIFGDSAFKSEVGLILIRTTSMIITYLISRYKVVSKKNYTIPRSYYLGILIILFGTLYLFTNSLSNDNLTIYSITVSGFALIAVNITLMLIDEKIYESLLIFSEQKILEQQNEAFRGQAHISSEANRAIRALKHDIKDHLITLNELYKNDKKVEFEKYISTIYGELNSKNISNSNNFIFDSILNLKLKKIIDKDVDLKLDINIPPAVNILEYDVTVVLGNLLDNAITATLESKEKKLVISISESMGNSIVILIDNTYNLIKSKGENKFETTKKNKKEHGLGLYNVEKVINKYDGELMISHTEDTFSVAAILPYL